MPPRVTPPSSVGRRPTRNAPTRTTRRRAVATRRRLAAGLCALALAISISSLAAARADDALACERAMTRAAERNEIPLNVLYSVGLTETGHSGALNPFDMNVDGRAVHSATLGEAMARFAAERARGARLIDIGCMQINHHWHAAEFGSLAEMFDPKRNVEYAAAFLKRLKSEEGSWTMAVARYNAGPEKPAAQRAYVCAVIRNMVASGFGAWTPNARALCL